jgi:hypothetical protein
MGCREQRRQRQRHELRRRRKADRRSCRERRGAGACDGQAEHRQHGQHRHERIVRVRLEGEHRVGIGRPREAERHPQLAARRPRAQATAEQHQPEQREQVEGQRGSVRRRQVIPDAAPGHRLLERDVGEVVHRPVGVAALDVVAEPRAVERVPVGDAVGADHTGVPDVDRAGVQHVEPRSEAHEQHDP